MASPAEPLGSVSQALCRSERPLFDALGSKFLADAKVEELRGLGTAALVNVGA